MSLDATTQAAPLAKDTLVGFTHHLATTSPQTLAGVTYEFTGWSDAGAIAHDISAPLVDASLVATFRPVTALSVSSPTVAEGDAGIANLSFTVTLSPASSGTVTATYTTANGTATAGVDYTAATGQVSFAPGVTSQLVTVAIAGDTDIESDETFTLGLSNPTGGAVIGAAGVGTITNDDQAALTISIGDIAIVEGNAGTANALVPVTLSAAATTAVSAQYVTAAGTATAGSDFTAATGTVTFAAGQTAATIAVTVAGDTLDEPDETVTVALSAPTGATLADSQGVVTITDDDAAPTISVADLTVSEGTATATVTLSLSAASGRPVSVTATTSNLTASAADYSAVAQSVAFAVGATTATLGVPITADVVDEANETFAVTLTAPVNATDWGWLGRGHDHRRRPGAVACDCRRVGARRQHRQQPRRVHRDAVGSIGPDRHRRLCDGRRHGEQRRLHDGVRHAHLRPGGDDPDVQRRRARRRRRRERRDVHRDAVRAGERGAR